MLHNVPCVNAYPSCPHALALSCVTTIACASISALPGLPPSALISRYPKDPLSRCGFMHVLLRGGSEQEQLHTT